MSIIASSTGNARKKKKKMIIINNHIWLSLSRTDENRKSDLITEVFTISYSHSILSSLFRQLLADDEVWHEFD